MKTFDKQAAQGDLLITKVDSIPDDLKLLEPEDDGDHIVAHSETGHHHVINSSDVKLYQAANDDFALYLIVDNETELKHKRSFDTHESLKITKGLYRINRQREYTAEGFRRAAD